MITKDELFLGLRQCATDERKLEFIDAQLSKMSAAVKAVALAARAEIYLRKRWNSLAATDWRNAASLVSTFREKTELYFKAALAHLLADSYIDADDAFRKVTVLSPVNERQKLNEKIKALYLERATSLEQEKHFTKAIAAFEKALSCRLDKETKFAIYDKLAQLYEQIGKPKEAIQMRQQKEAALKQLD